MPHFVFLRVLAMENGYCWIKSQSFDRGTCRPHNQDPNGLHGMKKYKFLCKNCGCINFKMRGRYAPQEFTLNPLYQLVGRRRGGGVIEIPIGVHLRNSLGFKLGPLCKNKISPMDPNLIAPNQLNI